MARRYNFGSGTRRSFVALMSVVGVLVATFACTPSTGAGSSSPDAKAVPPARIDVPFVPYVYVTMQRPTLADMADAIGNKNFVLAFVLAGEGRCDPFWGGSVPAGDPRVISEVTALKARGGSVVVATGGASGDYLESTCDTPEELAAAYAKALDAVSSNHLDVDVEKDVPVELLNQALAKVQQDRGTTITYTLPIDKHGLGQRSQAVLRSAANLHVVAKINVMAMNFKFDGEWVNAMIKAVETAVENVKSIWPDKSTEAIYRTLGVTAMIGRNDLGMTTTPDNARDLLAFARSRAMGSVGFWSITRDNGGCSGRKEVASNCSGIEQSPYEFSKIFGGHDS